MTDIVEEARAMLARWEARWPGSRLVDVVSALADECERLRAENARLREALPTDVERRAMHTLRGMTMPVFAMQGHEREALHKFESMLARLDAAKEGR